MCGPINVFEIIKDYCRHIREDLTWLLLVVILIGLPLSLAVLFYKSLSDIRKFYSSLIIVMSILIPLLLNLLMIVYYSIERTDKDEDKKEKIELKIEFLEHINSTVSMTILTAVFILFGSIILTNTKYTNRGVDFTIFYLVGFLVINVMITLVRIYRLIRHEIRTKREKVKREDQ